MLLQKEETFQRETEGISFQDVYVYICIFLFFNYHLPLFWCLRQIKQSSWSIRQIQVSEKNNKLVEIK